MYKSFSLFLLLLFPLLPGEKQEESFRVVAAGDIACPKRFEDQKRCQGKSVAEQMPQSDVILALGDLLQKGPPTKRNYNRHFFRTWPLPPEKLRAIPGNHDYRGGSQGLSGYRDFMKQHALTAKRWYSWRAPGWHVVGLDSNCDRVDCSLRGKQLAWLAKNLHKNKSKCLLAYSHHPFFHRGKKEYRPGIRNLWKVLRFYGADVILAGHQHLYERFPSVDGSGRQFTVGTGGVSIFRHPQHKLSQSQIKDYGFLSLELKKDSYSWSFQDNSGQTRDEGDDVCQSKNPDSARYLQSLEKGDRKDLLLLLE